ncbi:S-formylglutathione hydrolase [Mergibacter septicus]|uniref:S-formylglutathione hydrolase n=1 Tax=Mergibacter septicus TaxID=221402 RepID=A0A8D4IWQ0_9PAST|nr:S-formylglutathione hydrolase [Mergibacter septicus]AWX14786.1 S-formylglutathione hydrolase [Mergibacter septicus]QDJ14037.1 S-formylglutathione hydrolase [Mergibacter septicus]UTU48515.1 S-formylglutathione hydrolase [Mergibacter septicus]WMR95855.1 S-formylglutathione hydrolase [Mergibacter septicus]
MNLKKISSNKCFDGWHQQYHHYSNTLNCYMRFAIYLPPQIQMNQKVPVLYWLSGLTCTDENFMQKAGACRIASELGMALVAPDTSPRGDNIPDDPNNSYDFGIGAGFYLNATQSPWDQHYHMYDYIVKELPQLIENNFPVTTQRAIAGHSMGGHGALTIALKNPTMFSSVSAFSPITNPINCAWGKKAFIGYLGNNPKLWEEYDSCQLIQKADTSQPLPILIDQGSDDNFYLEKQLLPENLIQAAKRNNYPIQLRMQQGYDHSYYFIASFIEEHLKFHFKYFEM